MHDDSSKRNGTAAYVPPFSGCSHIRECGSVFQHRRESGSPTTCTDQQQCCPANPDASRDISTQGIFITRLGSTIPLRRSDFPGRTGPALDGRPVSPTGIQRQHIYRTADIVRICGRLQLHQGSGGVQVVIPSHEPGMCLKLMNDVLTSANDPHTLSSPVAIARTQVLVGEQFQGLPGSADLLKLKASNNRHSSFYAEEGYLGTYFSATHLNI